MNVEIKYNIMQRNKSFDDDLRQRTSLSDEGYITHRILSQASIMYDME